MPGQLPHSSLFPFLKTRTMWASLGIAGAPAGTTSLCSGPSALSVSAGGPLQSLPYGMVWYGICRAEVLLVGMVRSLAAASLSERPQSRSILDMPLVDYRTHRNEDE